MLTTEHIRTIADDVLRTALADVAFEGVDVVEELDHDDRPAVLLTAHFGLPLPSGQGARINRVHALLRTRLREAGEERFPYLSLQSRGDEDAEDEGTAAA